MSSEQPALSIQREVKDGSCRIVYTFAPVILKEMLEEANVQDASELSDEFLRDLCYRASQAEIERKWEETESRNPGSVALVIGCDDDGNEVEMRSTDIGFDMLQRFVSEEDPQDTLLGDPMYSPVTLELRVFDEQPLTETDASQNIGSCILSTTLYPPNLAD